MKCVLCGAPTDGSLQCSSCRETPRATESRVQHHANGGVYLVPMPGETRTHDPARADVLESQEQSAIVDWLQLSGFRVWRVGQQNARGTQDAGVPDLIVFKPGVFAFVEAKRPHGGQLSNAQQQFRACCYLAGVKYAWGSLDMIRDALAKDSAA